MKNLSINFCGVNFINPFLLSSSPASNCGEMIARAFDAGWGGVAFKTLATQKTKIIHPSPRLNNYNYESSKLIGLQNVEMISDRPLKYNLEDISWLKKHYPEHRIITSIMGFSNEEWKELAKASEDAGSDMLELNFSCPHMTVEGSGSKVGQAFDLVEKFTETVKNATTIPVIAKMTPNITDMNEPAMYAKKGGADAISAINTLASITGIGLDDLTPKPNVFGKGSISGYSGPCVKPVALRFVAEMAQNPELGLPISGIGGIENWIDALEFLLLGASTIQITTGIIHYGYRIIDDLIEGLSDYMEEKGFNSVGEIVGAALKHVHSTDEFDLERQGVVEYDIDRCIGCGQCYTVCQDAGGQAISWDYENRRPVMDEDRCVSCMACSFICPIEGLIQYKEMPKGWERYIPEPMSG